MSQALVPHGGYAASQNPLPSGISARQLIARAGELSETELAQLRAMGDAAWDPIYRFAWQRISQWCAQSMAAKSDADLPSVDLFFNSLKLLGSLMNPSHTEDVLRLLMMVRDVPTASGDPEFYLFSILTGEENFATPRSPGGDPAQVAPLCVAKLRRLDPTPGNGLTVYSTCLNYVRKSSHPAAVRFMLEKLRDPNASEDERHEAYVRLAGTGGKVGLRAVLSFRDTRRTLPSLRELMGLDKVGVEVKEQRSWDEPLVSTAQDGEGVLWGWFASDVIGSGNDRWLARREGERWSNPLFATTLKRGVDLKSWFTRFPAQAEELVADTDGDGWTDRVERRLGTDPTSPDTDRDGLRDSEDRNPLAAPRRLSQREQVLAAAFEARFHFSEGGGPCVVDMPSGIAPLEFAGWDGIIVAVPEGVRSSLAAVQREGVGEIGFSPPVYDFQGREMPEQLQQPQQPDPILWNANRTEAKLQVSSYYGLLNASSYEVHLRKYGKHWVVISCEMTSVS